MITAPPTKGNLQTHHIEWIRLICLVGLVAVVFATPHYRRIHGSMEWPTVIAVVQSNEIRVRLHRGDSFFIPRIRYRYSIHGVAFSGSALSFARREPSFRDRTGAEYVLLSYPTGSELKVHYNPSNPEESVVNPGLSDEQRVLVWMSCVLMLFFSSCILISSLKLRRAQV